MAKPELDAASLLRLVGSQVWIHSSMTGLRMAGPLMALREGYSAVAVGVLLALFALSQVFLALPAGRYADRHGVRRPVALSVVVSVAGVALSAAFPVFPVLCVSALAVGSATGIASIALQRHVGRVASGTMQMRQAFSWLAIGPAISNFIGPLAAGLLIDHAGFRAAFAALALMPLVAWLWVRNLEEAQTAQGGAATSGGPAWTLLREPHFRRLMLLNWALSSCWDVHTFVVPVLGHERGLSASVIGTLLGAFAVAATVVRLVLPVISARLREWQVILVAMVAATALCFVYPLMTAPWAMGLCSVLLGFALGSVQPMIMSMLHQITPEHRHGEALGLRLMAITASSVVMPILFGAAGAAVGVTGVFWAVGLVVGGSSRLPLGLRQHDALR